jgi:phosphatidylglycerophosphate synthase
MRRYVRLLAGMFGVLLLVYLVWRAGPSNLLKSIESVGWGLILVIGLGGVSHVVKTCAWRLILLDEKHGISFARMLKLRLGSEAVGQLGVLGQVFGENLRISLLSATMPPAKGIMSVTLDRAFFVFSAALASMVGMIAALVVLPLPLTLVLYVGLFAFILLGSILVTLRALRRRLAVFSLTAQLLGRVTYFGGWMKRQRSLISAVETNLFDFYHYAPDAFWRSFVLNLVCHGVAVLEVFLIVWLMGLKISFLTALAIEALTKLVNLLGTFNPGNIGTYEGGNMLIANIFGLGGAVGLTLGLVRRVRAIFWAAGGALCLVLLSKSKTRSNSDNALLSEPLPDKDVPGSHVAVILANDFHGNRQLPQVGALAVLLRAILGAQKAGAAQIAIITNRATRPGLVRDLQSTGRLPEAIQWFELGTGAGSLPAILARLVTETRKRLVLIASDRTYHPSLHQRVGGGYRAGGALALITGIQLVGIYALSRDVTLDLAKHGPSNIQCLEELHAWLTSTHSVACQPVQEAEWQRVHTAEDRLSAEQKLDRWIVKPTDGIFARINRRISIPISHQIIRFPITPNMVSLFTLGVSFLAGVFFACGGYRNMLLGALLSVFASILDGCDGEVARFKLQESDFGCWLETICDYLYYLFVFTGMTIGLLRTSGTRTYLVWGGLLLFGAFASFFVTGLQRHRLTAGRPEQLLGIWQAQAAGRSSNPLLYIGRHTEFIIRRCFLPYAFLFFALFNITQVAFILSALGANVVWLIALYSHRTFAAAPSPTPVPPSVSA